MKLLLAFSIVVLVVIHHVMGAANPWTPIEDQDAVQKFKETALKHFKKTKNQDAVFDRIVAADHIQEKSTSKAVRLVLVFKYPKSGSNKKEMIEMQCRYHFQEDGKVGHHDCPY